MGRPLPIDYMSHNHIQQLIDHRDSIDAQLDAHYSILKSNNISLNAPLVDAHGFPRDDIDIFAVRSARVKIIELRNDRTKLTAEIGLALEGVYTPSAIPPTSKPSISAPSPSSPVISQSTLIPFAKVDAVAPQSPAAESVRLKRSPLSWSHLFIWQGLIINDLILKFGLLTNPSPLQSIAQTVAANENVRDPDYRRCILNSQFHSDANRNISFKGFWGTFSQFETQERLGWSRDARVRNVLCRESCSNGIHSCHIIPYSSS